MGLKEKSRNFFRRTGAFILVIVLSLVSLSFIVHIPAVQKFGIEHIAGILSNTSGTRVEVGKFEFNFFNHLNLYDVYVETPGRIDDTLIFAQAIEVQFSNLLSVVAGKLDIKKVALRRVDLHFSRPDSSKVSTLTSFLRNFDKAQSNAEIRADSSSTKRRKTESNFQIDLDELSGDDLHVHYNDGHKNSIQDFYLEQVYVKFDKIDISNPLLRMDLVHLSGLSVDIEKLAVSLEDMVKDTSTGSFSVGKDSTSVVRPLRIEVREFQINKSHFALINHANQDSKPQGGIDYADMSIDSIDIAVANFTMEGLDFAGSIGNLSCIEKSGFALSKLSVVDAVVSSQGVILNGLDLETSRSVIRDTIRLTYDAYPDFKDFVNRVNIYATFNETRIAFEELMMTVPSLKQSSFFAQNQDLELELSGILSGNINRLRARNLVARLGDLQVHGEFTSRNLTVPNEQLLNLKVTRAVASAEILRNSIPGINLTSQFDRLGTSVFAGRFDGFFNDFVAYGAVSTDLGAARVDMRLDITNGADFAEYSGEIALDSFDVGGWTGNPDIGTISAAMRIDEGIGLNAETANANLNGDVQSMTYKGYVYSDVIVNGLLDENYFNGDLQVIDEHVRLSFNGSVDLRGEEPEFDFQASIDSMDLRALNIVKDTLLITGDFEVSGTITPTKGIEGYARASGFHIIRGGGNEFSLDTISLISEPVDSINHYTITSDYINGNIDGQFDLQSVYPQIAEHLSNEYPHVFGGLKYERDTSDATVDLDFDIVLSAPEQWRGLIGLDALSFGELGIAGAIDIPSDSMRLKLSTQHIKYDVLTFRELDASLTLGNGDIATVLTSDSVYINNYGLDSVTFAFEGDGSRLDWRFGVRDLFDSLTLSVAGDFVRDTSGLVVIQIDRNRSTLFDAGWEVHFSNRIAWKKDFIEIDSFSLVKGVRYIRISDINNRGINLSIHDFDLHYVDAIWDYDKLDFAGLYTLNASVDDIFSFNEVHVDLDVPDMQVNDDSYGLLALNIDMEAAGQPILMDMELGNAPNQVLKAKGWFNPAEKGSEKNLDIQIALDTFPAKFLEYFLDGSIVDTKGFLVGNVTIDGDTSQIDMNGSAVVHGGETTVVPLGVRYKLRDQNVILSKDFIDLTGTVIEDEEGNTATAVGGFYHTYLKDMGLDVQVTSDRMIGLDLAKSREAAFYGKAIGAATVDFQGPFKMPNLVINATTARGTQIYIPLGDGESAASGTFLQFVERDSLGNVFIEQEQQIISGMNLEMNLTVTPEAQVDFIFNEETRDIIRGRGSGDIQIVLTRTGEFSMYGGVEIESGNYLFTYVAVNKPFVIRPGGTLRWSGSPYDAQIDVAADYEGLRASLSTLLEEYLINATPNAQQQARQLTNVKLELLLTGSLLKPTINFNIEFPDITGELSGYADTKMKTLEANQNALNEQVFGLLMFRTFLPSNATRTSNNSVATVGLTNTISEFLSSQLSFFVSEFLEGAVEEVDFISGIDFDVGYTKSYDNLDQSATYSEWEVHMRNRLFNDRFIVDVGGSYVADNPIVPDAYFAGDYALEYILTEDRRLKIRVYFRNEETIEGRKNKTGIGLAYRREFDSFIAWLKGEEKDSKRSNKNKKSKNVDKNQATEVQDVGGIEN